MAMRSCHFCGTKTDDYCPTCVAAFPNRRLVADMTTNERAAELDRWRGVLEIPFTMLHQRIEELVGRPVWTHEMAKPESLIAEIRSGERSSFDAVLDKIPADKAIVVEYGR